MANRPRDLGNIRINGENKYGPTPHEVNTELPESMVWTRWPPDEQFMEDPDWYDATGQDMIAQRMTWAIQSESGQIDAFKELLSEFAHHKLEIVHAAAVKGEAHHGDDGTNAVEVAVGGGSVERAKQLLNTHENCIVRPGDSHGSFRCRPEQRARDVDFILKLGKYPRARPDGSWDDATARIELTVLDVCRPRDETPVS
ncbi:hypothetical protein AB5N19_03767 [Seiridium cardinale]